MLQESIGNTSCRTTMIAHVSPSLPFYAETLATVQLATRLHRLRKRKGKVSTSPMLATILDRIKWEMEAPLPPIQWCTRATTKTRHFSIIEMGGGVVLIFHPFCPRLWFDKFKNLGFRQKTKFRKRGAIKCKVGIANARRAPLASNL